MAGNIEDIPLKISSIENELSIAKDDITGIKTILYELIQRNPDISTLDCRRPCPRWITHSKRCRHAR
jgi:hypothetical protein